MPVLASRKIATPAGAALLVAVLSACSSPAAAPGAIICPEPKRYTADQEARAARELLALPAGSILAEMIVDYGRERSELRACRH